MLPTRGSGALALALLLPLALGACGSDTDPGPGGVTVGEAKALDDAASMLDEQRLATEMPSEAPTGAPGATEPPAAD